MSTPPPLPPNEAPPPPSYAPASVPTSTLAIASVVLGALSWFLLPLVGAIGAVITGHMARREIRDARGALQGDSLAIGGLVLGYLNLAVAVATVIFAIMVLGGVAALMFWAN